MSSQPLNERFNEQSSQLSTETYIAKSINPIFQQLLSELIRKKPNNVREFCHEWFDHNLKQECHSDTQSDVESEETTQKKQDCRRVLKWYQPRKGICGVIYSNQLCMDDLQQPLLQKSNVSSRILFQLKSLFLFNDFEDEQISKLINTMQEIKFQAKAIVVKENDQDTDIFFCESGELQCIKRIQNNEVVVQTIREGMMFGEMAMLYNFQRQATVRAKTSATLFKLERNNYIKLLSQRHYKKRKIVLNALDRIDLFRDLEQQEKYKIEGLIKQIPVHQNQYIYHQGKHNDHLYIIKTGKFAILKTDKNGHHLFVQRLSEGDFFGEVSFASRRVTAQSIFSLTNGKIYSIEKAALQRVIDSIEALVRRTAKAPQKINPV